MNFKSKSPNLIPLRDVTFGTVFRIPGDKEEIFVLIDKFSVDKVCTERAEDSIIPTYEELAVELITGSIQSFGGSVMVELVNYKFEEI